MTREEAIDEIKYIQLAANSRVSEALNMAKSALEQTGDAISRDAVLKEFEKGTENLYGRIDKLPSVTQKSGWILVSERLPEDRQEILFSTKTDRVYCGRYYLDKTCQNWYSFKDEMFAYDNAVTAWMPLPEPYKAESEE